MILILGASWARGEWKAPPNSTRPSPVDEHNGLMQYLEESGHQVLNLAAPGASNMKIVKTLLQWIEHNSLSDVEKIFIFQSDYTSDADVADVEDYNKIDSPYFLAKLWLERFYQQLSCIATQHKISIHLIGGGVDTIWFNESDYPGVVIACQSLVNLILNGNHRVDDPVYSWYTTHSLNIVKKIKEKLTTNQMPVFLKMLDQAQERENTIFNTTEYFWPDGYHPNRKGHKVLYDFLLNQGYLK